MLHPIEIKVNIEGAVTQALQSLGNPGEGSTRQVWFAEDRAELADGQLRLLDSGVIVRIRSGGGLDDTTVKLRPCEPAQLRDGWTADFTRGGVEYRIEGDWSGARHSLAASAVSTFGDGAQAHVAGAALGEYALTSSQRDFLTQCATPRVRLTDLIAVGPIVSTKWRDMKVGDIMVNAERWTAADLDFLELSIRVRPKSADTPYRFADRAENRQQRLIRAVERTGLAIATNTDNKTRRVLTALASEFPRNHCPAAAQ